MDSVVKLAREILSTPRTQWEGREPTTHEKLAAWVVMYAPVVEAAMALYDDRNAKLREALARWHVREHSVVDSMADCEHDPCRMAHAALRSSVNPKREEGA